MSPDENGPTSPRRLGVRYWVRVIAVGVAVNFAVLTLAWNDWIEIVFRVDPDEGSGSFEWVIVGVCAAIAVVAALGARHEWRRAAMPA